jgi:Kef-type K+ transport system membrane component KefB
LPAYLAGPFAGLAPRPSLTIGVLMNTRALTELIVINIGLEMNIVPALFSRCW